MANKMQNRPGRGIAVIGDGAMSAGMAYEAMNNAEQAGNRLVVILNDNDMSIAPPVGGLSAYLARMVSSSEYLGLRSMASRIARKMGRRVWGGLEKAEEYARGMVTGGTMFEELGFYYVGPIDGHNLDHLIPVLENVRDSEQGPVLIHVVTKKGKGYAPAENSADKYHGVAKFDVVTGEQKKSTGGPPAYQNVLGETLAKLANDDPRICAITAAMPSGTGVDKFAKAHPDRFYQMGMAEQLLMMSAAGMAKEGFIPFATTYAVFAARRTYDFIHQTAGEEKLNVKIACALPGLTTGYGPSHQATDDLAIFRAMPNLTIIDPCDALDIEQAVPAMAAHDGPVYMRLLRGNVPLVLDEYDYTFELGKAKMLRDGTDVLIISSGFMTMRALEAAKELDGDRVSAAVLHCPTIKPLDAETILREAARPGRLVVVAENHSAVGGLGEAVAGLLLRNGVTPAFRQIALPDAFLDAGALPTLHDRYGISTTAVVRQIKGWL